MMGTSLRRGLWAALVPLFLGPAGQASAATLPSGFAETQVASGMSSVTAMAIHPDGRVFVCQQGGSLRVIKMVNGTEQLLPTPFATVSVNASGERGLLGVTFDPDYATNRFVYVYHTTSASPIHNRIIRFTASASNQDVNDGTAPVVIFDLPSLSSATNHNGGAIHFGPDGKLYAAVGENANAANAISLNTTLGKVLRINKDGTIPSDNPFFAQTTGNNRAIWARGLRNPFTFAFQPGTGRMHINDVGQNTFEEVNNGLPGRDYGWNRTEGPNPPGVSGVTYPIFSYSTDLGCAIAGGAFYNPPVQQFPSVWNNRYFYSDFCGGFIRFLNPTGYTTSSPFATNVPFPVDLAVSPSGHLYYLARGQQGTGSNGQVWKVRSTTTCVEPTITTHPGNRIVTQGQTATFDVVAGGATPLTFQWQRADAATPTTFTNIAGATSATLSFTAQLSDNGDRFRAMVDNSCPGPAVASNAATLTVNAQGIIADITQPAAGTSFRGGQTISFAGVGSDADGNPLPASAFTWQVDLHHGTHTHPTVPPTSGITSGSFLVEPRGHPETNIFYRIHLMVNANGQTASDSVDVGPDIVNLVLATNPSAGLKVGVDGPPVSTAPFTFPSVIGMFRNISTSSPQTVGGTTYNFDSWSDDGALSHEILTPASPATFTANFTAEPNECVVGVSGQGWVNRLMENQTGTFTVRFDAIPSVSPLSGHVGISNGPQQAYAGFANIVRFNTSGNIDARNGGAYAAASTIPYTGGTTYHFRLAVNVTAHTYSIFVKPDGAANETTVGNNFAFRTEQASVGQLNYWGVYVQPTPVGQLTVCNWAIDTPPPPPTCVSATAGQGFVNNAFATQTGNINVQLDATPSVSLINSTIGFSNGAQTAHTGLAAIVRFNTTGTIDARNGGAYAAASNIPYTGGQTYHFRLAIDQPAHTYSVFVTPPGGSEQTVGSNFAFRTEQAGLNQFSNWNVWVGSPTGASTNVCNFTLGSGPSPPPVPTGLTASPASTSQINVSWNAATGATGYDLEADGSVVSDVTSPYAHTGLAAGSTHTYRVRSKNAVGMSAFSSPVSATTQTAACASAPSAPTDLHTTSVGSTSVALAWTASPPIPNCTVQYQVRQNGVQVGTTSGTAHTVSGLSPSTTYSFVIRAVNQVGSADSAPLSVTTSSSGGTTPVAINGQLHVCGTKLCNQFNNPIQLRGMSTHGLQWYGRGTGSDNCVPDVALDALANDWKADILRISMYIQEGGYETNPTRFTNEVSALIDEVTERGMYALVDWHMLDPGDPNVNLSRARTFFTEIATRHNNKNNIIYEIANEPNGVTWSRVKTYAEALIPTIRAIDPDAVILVGTRAWSSLGVSDGATADETINNPVNATNIMYTFHFYAASHLTEYRNELSRAADMIPMFVTEFGTQTFTGDGGNNFPSAQAYLDLMRAKKISWTNWNYSHDFRSGAVFTVGTCPNGPFAGTSRLKPAGVWVRERIINPPDDFPIN
jgi:glucose/arabinose dehydrogenase/aryl-phospho-beta-D-glucosidase BglC (GH1 family)